MPHLEQAERLPFPNRWERWCEWEEQLSFRVPTGWTQARLGPPGFDDPSSGAGRMYAWGLRFPCGFECVLCLWPDWDPDPARPDTDLLSVDLRVPEFEHALRHLELPVEWLVFRLDQSDRASEEERARIHRDRDTWEVWRQDDNGNTFVMQTAASEQEARCVADTFERRAHKQMYWVRERL